MSAGKGKELIKIGKSPLFNSLVDGIMILDPDACCVQINQAAADIFAVNPEHFIGQNVVECHSPLFQAQVLELMEEFRSGNKEAYEKRNIKVNQRLLDVFMTPLRDSKNRFLGLIMMVRDVTREREMQDKLIRQEKLAVVGQLAAGLAHEIRNPLTTVMGFMQLLNPLLPEGKAREYAALVNEELRRIKGLVSEILLLTKPSAPNFRDVDLINLVRETLAVMVSEANLKGVALEGVTYGQAYVRADREQIKQVLVNFIKNAVDACGSRGKVVVEVESREQEWAVLVMDDGPGLPPEVLNKVFEPFFTTKEEGMGLGLVVSKQIAETHGGRIELGNWPTGGAVATLYLPKLSRTH
ncbi:PAS domain S-box-containing protein [Carboxydocella sporoproducens DSM 16521]|uniref:histidine kinase n=2 Tax=Carboxydocella TaxID=178898 RepID=A0A1T4NBL0_9FIRM|nr:MULTISPECIES: ATP-binding protein [Carboxydocella]AVX20975.1 PAS domain S-box-containing protein [Carboxydocella thermautotrophica]SJZ76495.1 PAS domain S-box-containing protein [Carboxydocella sporoproducens DSM 16521]